MQETRRESEQDYAIRLANCVLEKRGIDPDGTECVLARQFLRAVERTQQVYEAISPARINVDHDYYLNVAKKLREAAINAGQVVVMKEPLERDDYNEPYILAKQRVSIVENMMKLPYIKQTRDTEEGEIRFIARDDFIKMMHDMFVCRPPR